MVSIDMQRLFVVRSASVFCPEPGLVEPDVLLTEGELSEFRQPRVQEKSVQLARRGEWKLDVAIELLFTKRRFVICDLGR